MKKFLGVAGVAVLVLMARIAPASAEDNAFTKFGRGMSNIVISPGEFYTQPVMMSENNPVSTAMFGGFLKGGALFLAREAVGIYEVLTFPFPNPKGKGFGPILSPATTFTDWDTRQPQS